MNRAELMAEDKEMLALMLENGAKDCYKLDRKLREMTSLVKSIEDWLRPQSVKEADHLRKLRLEIVGEENES